MELNIFRIIDTYVESLTEATGMPTDQTKIIIIHLFIIPFGFGFQRIENVTLRKLISTFLGIFTLIIMYGALALTIIPIVIFMYYLTYFSKKNREITIFIASYIILCGYHLYNLIVFNKLN